MVASNKQREELRHWESELHKYEINNQAAKDAFEQEHWTHMCNYASQKILRLEDQIYNKTS